MTIVKGDPGQNICIDIFFTERNYGRKEFMKSKWLRERERERERERGHRILFLPIPKNSFIVSVTVPLSFTRLCSFRNSYVDR